MIAGGTMAAALSWAASQTWAMEESAFLTQWHVLQGADPLQPIPAQALTPRADSSTPLRKLGVLPIVGSITYRGDIWTRLFGGTAVVSALQQLDLLLRDAEVETIVLHVDSPGGTTTGLQELATAIREAGRRKRVIAVVDQLAASAAYYLASQADLILATPSGQVGSIGAFVLHVDISAALARQGVTPTLIYAGRFKTEGNPFEPLTDAARNHTQGALDRTYGEFLAAVAHGRGKTPAVVRAKFGEGRLVHAAEAFGLGMVDRIMPTPAAAFQLIGDAQRQGGLTRAAMLAEHQLDVDRIAVTLAMIENHHG